MTKWICVLCSVIAAGMAIAASAGGSRQGPEAVLEGDVQLASFVDLDYPPVARAARVQGIVVVTIALNGEGDVLSASAMSGDRVLIEPALENVKKWKFKPRRQRQAVIVYNFSIQSGVCHDRHRNLFLLEHWNYASIQSCDEVLQTAAPTR